MLEAHTLLAGMESARNRYANPQDEARILDLHEALLAAPLTEANPRAEYGETQQMTREERGAAPAELQYLGHEEKGKPLTAGQAATPMPGPHYPHTPYAIPLSAAATTHEICGHNHPPPLKIHGADERKTGYRGGGEAPSMIDLFLSLCARQGHPER